jgi:hypothetical protein
MNKLSCCLVIVLLFAVGCRSNRPAQNHDAITETTILQQYTIAHNHALVDNRLLQTLIWHSDDTVFIPQSHVLMLLVNDTLLKKEYYSYIRLLKPESYGITNPVPAGQDVVIAFGGEFAETGSFLYLVDDEDQYKLYELLTSPKDGAPNTAVLLKAFPKSGN